MAIIASQKAVSSAFDSDFGGLDHQRPDDGKRHRRRVEAVVHQALGHVLDGARRAAFKPRGSRMHSCATRPSGP